MIALGPENNFWGHIENFFLVHDTCKVLREPGDGTLFQGYKTIYRGTHPTVRAFSISFSHDVKLVLVPE